MKWLSSLSGQVFNKPWWKNVTTEGTEELNQILEYTEREEMSFNLFEFNIFSGSPVR